MFTLRNMVAMGLLAGLMVIHPAQADDDTARKAGSQAEDKPCVEGSADCRPATRLARAEKASGHHAERQPVCAKDAQDCDHRSKENRVRAADEARDRHACRD
jgi:hypothetical protein